MQTVTEKVDSQSCSGLQPGVLRVRSDGKRIYAEDFKADLVRQCLVPGTSVAATGMAHGINANLLRRWIVLQSARSGPTATPPALLPVIVRVDFTRIFGQISTSSYRAFVTVSIWPKAQIRFN
jgi:hypothetical protein